jgi:hypothetical protein
VGLDDRAKAWLCAEEEGDLHRGPTQKRPRSLLICIPQPSAGHPPQGPQRAAERGLDARLSLTVISLLIGKVTSMSDVEKEIDELQSKLATKTRQIEMLVAEERHLGDIDAMESTDYARLRTYVEELIEKWQEADVDHPGSNPDTAINRLIAAREEIEEQILALQVR